LFVVTAIRAIRSSKRTAARLMLVGAIACGAVFVGLKAIEYTAKVTEGHTPAQNGFYLYYFILTGLHLFHVLIGITVLVLLLTQAGRTEFSTKRMALVEGGGCFWHLVDLLWIVLFPLLYLVS
jgi:nitric oxide reductase NorE protein